MIGVRIPTEGKNSMFPLYVKEFLPSNGGTNIMMASEITKIAGSDFDLDKIYLNVKELDNKGFPIQYDADMKVKDYDSNTAKAQRNNKIIDIN